MSCPPPFLHGEMSLRDFLHLMRYVNSQSLNPQFLKGLAKQLLAPRW